MTWFVLVITVSGVEVGHVPFGDPMTCGNALPALHAAITAEWPDAMMQCKDSGIAKARPRGRDDE